MRMNNEVRSLNVRVISVVWALMCLCVGIQAQPTNDNCQGALTLTDVRNSCSDAGEYTNVSATASGFATANCWNNASNDVWFIFTAQATDITITIRGNTGQGSGGTLQNPEAALYAGGCGGTISQLGCSSDQSGFNVTEFTEAGLIVGVTYLIRVQGLNGNTGTFQICLNNFNPPVEPTSDCPTGALLCDKSPFSVASTLSAGSDITEMDDATCFFNGSPNNIESRSTWFKWIAANDGDLTFTLSPTNLPDDLDFAIYELPNGFDDCTDKILVRCMASGDFNFPSRCMGPTGLRSGETDISEPAGCQNAFQTNFIAPLNMTQGTAYALVVNNFTASGNGFSIEFGGSGEFLGPQVDFDVDPELNNQCDIDQILVVDQSSFLLGNIVGWSWTFGSGALTQTASGPGPHNIIYGSFGTKSIVLTVETDLGCVVTEIKEIFIEPCCDPNNTLDAGISSQQDVICFGEENGLFVVDGTGGSLGYQFSLDGVNFTPSNVFGNLGAGLYTVFIQDQKGCVNSTDVVINEPPPIIVDVGPDLTVDLGAPTVINATYNPMNFTDSIFWTGSPTTMSCVDCLNPVVIAPGQTTYTLTVIDENNCVGKDSLTVFVDLNRPVYIPNAFSPNFDGLNDRFTAYANPGARLMKEFRIFDRWGGLIFERTDIPLNDESFGWDGMLKGQIMNNGIYTYYLSIEFIDDVVVLYEGDVALMR